MDPKVRIRVRPAAATAIPGHVRALRAARVQSILLARSLDRPSHLERTHRLQRVERVLSDRPGPGDR